MAQFIFDSYRFEPDRRLLSFSYEIIREGKKHAFQEEIHLPERPFVDYSEDLLSQVLQSVHLVLGLSYWKIWCPDKILIKNFTLTSTQAEYWNTVYTKGLGEFFYRNSIDFRGLISFPSDATTVVPSVTRTSTKKYLVGVGGGKDSAVTVEILKKNDVEIEGFVVETGKSYGIIDEMIRISHIPALRMRRIIDPQMLTLNSQTGTFNGHVPISAVYAWLSMLASVLYGFDGYIASNERSANIGNVQYHGIEINHQWSKSLEFEMMTREYLSQLSIPSFEYISLLRPFSEFAIVEKFINYSQYFPVFSSCNRNFSQSRTSEIKWCGECPKCAFVFALLAGQLERDKVISIFGADLFERESLLPVYRELLGIEGIKPFECVGTPEEVSYALFLASQKGSYHGTPVMNMFEKDVLPTLDHDRLDREVHATDLTSLPEVFQHML